MNRASGHKELLVKEALHIWAVTKGGSSINRDGGVKLWDCWIVAGGVELWDCWVAAVRRYEQGSWYHQQKHNHNGWLIPLLFSEGVPLRTCSHIPWWLCGHKWLFTCDYALSLHSSLWNCICDYALSLQTSLWNCTSDQPWFSFTSHSHLTPPFVSADVYTNLIEV